MKNGIPYFPLDCQLDEKIELIEAEFGLTGFAVVVKLLQRIYGGEGYYCEWTDEVALLFSKRVGEGCKVVSEIVAASIKRGIFSQKLFDQYHILTSHGVQLRYLEAVARRKKVEMKNEYLLVPCDLLPKNVDILSENADIYRKNAYISEQRKEEKRKGKERREKKPLPASLDEYRNVFMQACPSFQPLTPSDGWTVSRIEEIAGKGLTPEQMRPVFERVEKSDFLTGRNGKWEGCSIDWILKPDNWTKIIEGAYDNQKKRLPRNGGPSFDLEAYERDSAYDVFREEGAHEGHMDIHGD